MATPDNPLEDAVAPEAEPVLESAEGSELSEAPAKKSRGSLLRRLGRGLGWLLGCILALLVSVAVHLNTAVLRKAAADILNDYVSGQMRGTLRIGSIDRIVVGVTGNADVWVSNVALDDPSGEEVITGERAHLVIDLGFALGGGLRFSHARLEGGALRLLEGADGLPSFLEAFEAADPTPSTGEPFHAVVDDLHLEGIDASGTLLGIEGIHIPDLWAHGRMEFEESTVIDVFRAGGSIVAPWPFDAQIDQLNARIDTTPHIGTRLHAQVSTQEGDEVGVNLVYAVPEGAPEDGESELDILLNARPLEASRLADLGFGWAEVLQGPTRGHVRFYGPSDDLRMRGALQTEGGEARLQMHLPDSGDVTLSMETGGLDLTTIVQGAPPLTVAGSVRLAVEGEDVRVIADLEPFEFEGMSVPPSHIEGRIEEEQFRVDRATVHTAAGDLELEGDVDFEGNVDLRVSGVVGAVQREPLLAELVPGARGRLEADGTVRLRDGVLDARGRFILRNFRYGPVEVRRIIATGHVDGDLSAPVVRLNFNADGTRVSGYPLGDGEGRLAGGPTRYDLRMAFARQGQQLRTEGAFRVVPGGIAAEVPLITLHGHGQRWRGHLQGLRLQGGRMAFDELALEDGTDAIRASMAWTFRPRTEDHFRADMRNVTLEEVLAWLPEEQRLALRGTLDGEVDIRGDFEGQPRIAIEGHIADFAYEDLSDFDVDFMATHDEAQVGIDARLFADAHGGLDVEVRGVLDEGVPLFEAWRDGAYESRLTAEDFDLGLLGAYAPDLPEVGGRVRGTLTASGAYGIFDFNGDLEVPALRVGEFPPIAVRSRLSYDSGSLIVRALTLDDAGELVEGEVSLLLDLASIAEDPSLLAPMLEVAPWRASFRMAPRDLGTLPAPIVEQTPLLSNLRASATLTVRGGAFRPVADVIADVEWIGDLTATRCGQGGVPRIALRAGLEQGIARVEARGLIDRQPVLYLEADAPAPIDEWIAGRGEVALPPTAMALYLQNVPLSEVPFVCEYAGGPLNAVLTARDVFTDEARAFLDVAGDELHVRRLAEVSGAVQDGDPLAVVAQSPPFRVRMESRVGGGRAKLEFDGRWWNGGTLFANGEIALPLEDGIPTVPTDSPIDVQAAFAGTPLEVALFWLPSLSDVAGVADGDVSIGGTVGDPELAGALDIRHGQVEIESLGQRLDDVEGALLFEEGQITLQNVFASDGDGSLRIAGDVSLDGFFPEAFHLQLAATDFPVRQEGSIIASLTGDARLETTLAATEMVGKLFVDELTVSLPDDQGRSPIGLDPHPDIEVIGENGAAAPADPFRLALRIDASRPFVLLGDGLSATLTAELDVEYEDPEFLVRGGVELLDGNFQVFGRDFDVEQGWLRFDGGPRLDPMVNLVAVHPLRSRPGDTVTVTAGHRLSNPDVRFSSSVTNDQAEIIALLVSGNVRQETADEAAHQATDFLTGVLSGALTLTLREEFGAYIPNITVQSNSLGGNRFGGGWNVEQLLPASVRDVILGMYIEGFVNTRGSDTAASTSQVFGVRIELDLPRSVQTSATYEAPAGWGADVTWTP